MEFVQLHRRDVLYGLGGLGLWSLFGFRAPARGPSGYLIGGHDKDFVMIDLSTGEIVTVPTPTVGHSFLPWPHQKGCFVSVEKNGDSLSLVDFKAKKVLLSLKCPAPYRFYGHLALTPSGTEFLSSQLSTKTGRGSIMALDSKTFAVKEEMFTAAGNIHDLAFLPDHPRTLVHTSSGVQRTYENGKVVKANRVEKAGIGYFDTETKKVLETQTLDDESMICGHLAVFPKDRVVVVTTPFDEYHGPKKTAAGSAYISRRGSTLKEMDVPLSVRKSMSDELLSVVIDPDSQMIVVTNPKGHHVLFFDGKNEKFIESIPVSSTGAAFEPGLRRLFLSVRGNDPEYTAPKGLSIADLGRKNPLTSSHFLYVPAL